MLSLFLYKIIKNYTLAFVLIEFLDYTRTLLLG